MPIAPGRKASPVPFALDAPGASGDRMTRGAHHELSTRALATAAVAAQTGGLFIGRFATADAMTTFTATIPVDCTSTRIDLPGDGRTIRDLRFMNTTFSGDRVEGSMSGWGGLFDAGSAEVPIMDAMGSLVFEFGDADSIVVAVMTNWHRTVRARPSMERNSRPSPGEPGSSSGHVGRCSPPRVRTAAGATPSNCSTSHHA